MMIMMMNMRILLPGVVAAVTVLSLGLYAQAPAPSASARAVKSLYDLKTKSLEGKPADLAMYRGKVSLGQGFHRFHRFHLVLQRRDRDTRHP